MLWTNAAVNPCVQVFGWTCFQFFWVYTWSGPAVCRWDRRKDFPPSKATLTLMVMPLRSLPHPGAFPEPCCVSGPLKGLLTPVRTSISGPGFLAWFPILRGKKGTDCSISSPGFLSPFCWIHHLMQPCYGPCAAGRTWTWSHAGLSLNPGFATCWQITVALGKSYNLSSAQLVHL